MVIELGVTCHIRKSDLLFAIYNLLTLRPDCVDQEGCEERCGGDTRQRRRGLHPRHPRQVCSVLVLHTAWLLPGLQRCLHLWVTVQELGTICTVPAAASISLMSHLHTASAPEQPLVASVSSSQCGNMCPAQDLATATAATAPEEKTSKCGKSILQSPACPTVSHSPMLSAGVCQDDSRRKCPHLSI